MNNAEEFEDMPPEPSIEDLEAEEEIQRHEEEQREAQILDETTQEYAESVRKILEDQDLEGMLTEDFVDSWNLFLDHQTDAHWSFKEITGLFLISMMTFHKWLFLDFSRSMVYTDLIRDETIGITKKPNQQSFGGFFLNLWVMMLGKSRIAHKTTVIRIVKHMIKKLSTAYDSDEPDSIHPTTTILPDEFNPASFIQAMNRRIKDGFCYASWIEDEVSRFYEHMGAGAGYMAGMAPLLSKLYDPLDSYSKETMARGVETIDRSYFNILTSSTLALPQLFNEREIMTGFLNRFMYVLDDVKDRKDRLDPAETGYSIYKKKKELLNWLIAVRDACTVTIFLMPRTPEKKYYDKYEKEINAMIREDKVTELYQGYVGNLPDFLLKLASLYRISRIPYNVIEDYYSVSTTGVGIELQDLERAKKLVDILFENFKQVVRLSRKKTAIGVTYSQDSNLITVYEAIEFVADEKTGFATRTNVSKKSGVGSKQLDQTIADLIERDCIRVEWGTLEGAGRRPQLLKAVHPPV